MVGNRDLFLDRAKMELFALHLNHCGIQKCTRGYTWGFQMRPYHLVHFVLEGSGTLEVNKQVVNIHAGQAFFIPAGTGCTYRASLDDPWKYCWVGFYGDSRSPFAGLLFGGGQVIDLSISLEKVEEMVLSILAVSDERLGNLECFDEEGFPGEQFSTITDLCCSLEANSRMYHLFARLLDTQLDSLELSPGGGNPAQDAKAFMDAAYSEHIKIQDVADALHVHPNYLSSVFKKEYGQTPSEYLRGVRMTQAGMLLTFTDYPVSAVASAVGYGNAFQFSSTFRKYYHMSPTDFRREK